VSKTSLAKNNRPPAAAGGLYGEQNPLLHFQDVLPDSARVTFKQYGIR
jgi:hypothetical protein